MNLSDKALLVQLNISQWTARKLDRKTTAKVAADAQASKDAGSYRAALLPASQQLAAVHAKTSSIRFGFYDNTLPWLLDSIQMLPSTNYLHFTSEFRSDKAVWEGLVTSFLADYSQLVIEAQTSRGSMYDPKDYPPVEEVRAKFSMGMRVMPVPGDDFRVEVSDEAMASIRTEVQATVDDSMKGATQELWQRLYDKVVWLEDRLSDPNNTFKESMYAQLEEYCTMVPRLNFMEDDDLNSTRLMVQTRLSRHNVQSLRNDPDLRTAVHRDAANIVTKMKIHMAAL